MAAREPFYAKAALTVECGAMSDEELSGLILNAFHAAEYAITPHRGL